MKPLKLRDTLNESIEMQELEGPIEKAIALMQSLVNKYPQHFNMTLRLPYNDGEGHREFYIDADRWETDEEVRDRVDIAKRAKEEKKRAEKQRALERKEQDLKELARLKKKYEGKK